MITILNYIDGKLTAPEYEKYFDNIAPAVGQAYSKIPDSQEVDVSNAVESAQNAFKDWSGQPAKNRAEWLRKIAAGINDRFEEFVRAESKDNGKPIKLAEKVDIPRAMRNFQFYASAIEQYTSEAHPMEGVGINYTLKKPLGVVGCISPWNLPLYLFSWKIAPALAAGNTVVAKPSEITPMTAFLLAEVCESIGLPKGVLNIVHGYGHSVGNAITEHSDVKAISFTGGTKTGKTIAAKAAPEFKKLSLELGGKNPNIIFEDCDFDKMIKTTLRSSFANQGQICLCGSRIFVASSIYEKFKSAFVAATEKMVVDHPDSEKADLGAIVSKEHFNKIKSCIALAKEEGGKILTGGHAVEMNVPYDQGYFLAPTIIEGLPQDCRTNREEIFGPVVTIMPFDDEDEVIKYANDTEYGLSATVWTQDLNRAHRVAELLESGIIWVNSWLVRDLRTPFGGMKSSGVGREGGFHALDFFTESKNIFISY